MRLGRKLINFEKDKMYSVKEIFYSLQGEGAQAGRAAVFVRFAGCNLWSGREEDRAAAQCSFCDTDFVGTNGVNGGQFATAGSLVEAVEQLVAPLTPMVIFTGGEPLLQVDARLVDGFKARGFFTALETNGTLEAPSNLDWICVSPKAGTEIVQRSGDELKVVFGQEGLDYEGLLEWDFQHFYLQPMDGPDIDHFTQQAIAMCKAQPRWRLSVQSHKILQIP